MSFKKHLILSTAIVFCCLGVANADPTTPPYIVNSGSTLILPLAGGETTFAGNNNALGGGGVINSQGNVTLGAISIGTSASSNQAAYGGAVYNDTGASLSANNTSFQNNIANYNGGDGGAIHNSGTISSMNLVNIAGNTATNNGGGIYNGGTGLIDRLNARVISNVADTGNGAGIYNDGIVNLITHSVFTGNSATQGNGGAIYNIGEINGIEENTTFGETGNGNTAINGGAIYNEGTITVGNEVSFTENTATDCGGAIYNTAGTLTLGNTIFTNNQASTAGGALYNDTLGSVVFTGSTSFTGNTANALANDIHNDGTMEVVSGAFVSVEGTVTGTGDIHIQNGGTLTTQSDIANKVITDGTYTMTGAVSLLNTIEGTGTLRLNDTATLTSVGNHTLSVTGIENNGTLAFNDGVTNIESTLSGSGNLKIGVSGEVSYLGNLTQNIENDGILRFKSGNSVLGGTYTGNEIIVENGAELDLGINTDGTFTNNGTTNVKGDISFTGTFINQGILDIAAQAISVNNITFEDNSTLKLTVNGTQSGNYGTLTVGSTPVLGNNLTLDMTIADGIINYKQSATLTLLNQTGGSVGDWFSVLNTGDRYKITSNGDGSYLIENTTTAEEYVKDLGASDELASLAQAWDSTFDADTTASSVATELNKLATENPKEFIDSLTGLGPESSPVAQATTLQNLNMIYASVNRRMNARPAPQYRSWKELDKSVAVWLEGFSGKSTLDDTKEFKGFDADNRGAMLGLDFYIGDLVKMSLAYAFSQTEVTSVNRKTDIDAHTGLVALEYQPNNFYINFIGSYSYEEFTERKNVAGIRVDADYDMNVFAAQTMMGYTFDSAHHGATEWTTDFFLLPRGMIVTPEIGARYVVMDMKNYKDSADQYIKAETAETLTAIGGLKLARPFQMNESLVFTPEIFGYATYDIISDEMNTAVTMPNGSSYQTAGRRLEKFGAEAGARFSFVVNDTFDFTMSYEGAFRKDYTGHGVLLGLKASF